MAKSRNHRIFSFCRLIANFTMNKRCSFCNNILHFALAARIAISSSYLGTARLEELEEFSG